MSQPIVIFQGLSLLFSNALSLFSHLILLKCSMFPLKLAYPQFAPLAGIMCFMRKCLVKSYENLVKHYFLMTKNIGTVFEIKYFFYIVI